MWDFEIKSRHKGMKKRHYTTSLFPVPGLLYALGSIFNIPGNYYKYNVSKSEKEADIRALNNDWSIIFQDLEDTIGIERRKNRLDSDEKSNNKDKVCLADY